MKFASLLAAAVLAASTPVLAADLGPAPAEPVAPIYLPFSWTGFYVGAQAGYSWFDGKQTFPPFDPSTFYSNLRPNTFTLGGQAGYRYQFNGGVVVGVEGDIYSYFDQNVKEPIAGAAPNGAELTVKFGGSAKAQLGYAFDRFLPYVTGGVAFIDYSGGSAVIVGGPIFPGTAYSETKVGWTVGAGLAYAFTDHWVGNVEYRYSDYGSSNFATPFAFAGTTKLKLTENAIKLGISYKF